ncbi:MAG TPA: TlpA disulfide reductase family protein [Chitinophagales bacterium]|nr:TlpA disulfide reductase family protein [Chitinophagales bacterium]
MRNYFQVKYFVFFAFLFTIWSCKSDFKGTTINGDILNAENHLLLLEDVATAQKVIIDSARVINNKVSFQVYINEGIYRLRDEKSNQMAFIYIRKEGDEIYLRWDLKNSDEYIITGNEPSKQLKYLVDFSKKSALGYNEIDSTALKDSLSVERVLELKDKHRAKVLAKTKEFIESEKNVDVAAFALNYVGAIPENINYLIEVTEKLHQKNPEARYSEVWYESMESYRKQLLDKVENGLAVGVKAPEFESLTIKGDTLKLKNLLGSYVLLDFWASWCQPCRKENPNLVAAYKEFSKRKFTIVSISLDSKLDQLQKGIKVDGLNWPYHISDLLKWRSPLIKQYEVKAIPLNYLINPTGEIIAKDLKGAALISTLDKLLPPEMIEVTDSTGKVSLVPKYPVSAKDSVK